MAGKRADWRRSIERLVKPHGLHVEVAKAGHLKVRNAEGKTVMTCSQSPSDGARALRNVEQTLRYVLNHQGPREEAMAHAD